MTSLIFRFARATSSQSGIRCFAGSYLLKSSSSPVIYKCDLQFLMPLRACSTLVDHASDRLEDKDNQQPVKAIERRSNELDIAHYNTKLQEISDREDWKSVST